MPHLTGGEAVVEALKREGVEYIFGIPGIQIMAIYDAMYGRRDIRPISVRHEQTAVYMADGYARVKGKPGVALVVPGPGVQNASAALGTAYACSSPVLLIAGQVESFNVGKDKGSLHEIHDQLEVVRPVTKWCHRVMERDKIPAAIHEAMRQMAVGRPRPVYVEIPWDTVAGKSDVEFPERESFPRLKPNREEVKKAAELLISARRPLIWAGGGVISAGAAEELTALAEKLGAPVAMTAEGKGGIPETHFLSLGGAYYGFGAVRWATPTADVILAVGTRLTWQMRPGTAPKPTQRLIHLDADPDVIGKNFPAEVALVADAKEGLRALLEEIQGKAISKERWVLPELEECREKHRGWLRRQAPLQGEVIGKIRKVIGEAGDLGKRDHECRILVQPGIPCFPSAHLPDLVLFCHARLCLPNRLGSKGGRSRQTRCLCYRGRGISLCRRRTGYGGSIRDQLGDDRFQRSGLWFHQERPAEKLPGKNRRNGSQEPGLCKIGGGFRGQRNEVGSG